MTNATVRDFVKELRELNPEKSADIKVGRGIDNVIYTGGDPRNLVPPEPFSWDEEHQGFSDLQVLKNLGLSPMYQLFTVSEGN